MAAHGKNRELAGLRQSGRLGIEPAQNKTANGYMEANVPGV